MSDRLALAHAIEDAGHRAGEGRGHGLAAIARFLEGNVATKADVQASEAMLRSEMAALRGEVHSGFARQDVAIERLRSGQREMEGRLLLRLGGWMVALLGVLFAALHAWPPH